MGEERRAGCLRLRVHAFPPSPPGNEVTRGGNRRKLATVRLERVTRSFAIAGALMPVLEDVSFDVPSGRVTTVVGPNGSGKSTLLRLICGLLAPDSGGVTVDGAPVADGDPRIGLVFQEPRLLPWRTVVDNVAFPLQLAGMDRRERRERARRHLDLVGVAGFADAYPHQLSGGMRQRTAIARALARDPSVLLLDEPFSALDALTRERFDTELLDLWQRTGTTVIAVTHSIPEAVFLADEVVVLSSRPGRVVARVAIDLPRPRDPSVHETVAFAAAAARVRAHLAGTPAEYAAQEAAAPPIHDVLERAGSPAWFDPFRGA